jgi:hypothetical protein
MHHRYKDCTNRLEGHTIVSDDDWDYDPNVVNCAKCREDLELGTEICRICGAFECGCAHDSKNNRRVGDPKLRDALEAAGYKVRLSTSYSDETASYLVSVPGPFVTGDALELATVYVDAENRKARIDLTRYFVHASFGYREPDFTLGTDDIDAVLAALRTVHEDSLRYIEEEES